LAKDQFLLSQLNATEHLGAVPIEVICDFPKVRHLHAVARINPNIPVSMAPSADPRILRMALYGSSVVGVSDDGMWITPYSMITPYCIPEPRPTAFFDKEETTYSSATVATSTTTVASTPSSPSSQATGTSSLGVPTHPLPFRERDTVIVRDVPENVSVEAVMAALSTDNVIPKSAQPDAENTWYVLFESEAQATEALSATRSRTIAGAPIRCGLKSEEPDNSKGHQVPPVMPLPPPQDMMKHTEPNLRPKPPQAFAQYPSANMVPSSYPQQHSAMQMPPQQPLAYGYVPYPYSMQMPQQQQQQQMAYQTQQQYFQPYGYAQQYAPPSPHQTHNEGYSAPPPHVFVRPKPSQNSKKKKNNRSSKGKAHKQQQQNITNAGEHSVTPTALNTNQAHPQRNKNNGNKNRDVEGSTSASNGNKKNSKNLRGKKNSDNNKTDQGKPAVDMSADNFPALGGGETNKPKALPTVDRTGYAQALLKRPSPQKSPAPAKAKSSATDNAELESAMNSLAFTEAGAASYDEW
jgi:hypothetical protein